MKISIIIPVFNEEENISNVLKEIIEVQPDSEIIVINDGSTDRTASELTLFPDIKVICFPTNKGKSLAIYEGLKQATNEYCVLMDGDGQYEACDIKYLMGHIGNADLICGYRHKRMDSNITIYVSKIANFMRDMVFKDGIRDIACGLKVIKREHVHILPCFEGMHRFIPIFFKHANLHVIELPVNHRPRIFGKSKYTHLHRAKKGITDMIRVKSLLK
jgi:dolichol-phosphate mannosyltransferase